MFTFLRIYAFKRRCGLSRWQAARRAFAAIARDASFKRQPRL